MLQSLLALARGAGIDARWVVIEGEPDFFTLTKRLHHLLHGSPGDGGPTGDAERTVYERVTHGNAVALAELVRPGDIVLLHDPQTIGMASVLRKAGAHVVWRSHIGIDVPNDQVRQAWRFLLPYVTEADAFVFTRNSYVPPELAGRDIVIIPPSIDVFSQKNQEMSEAQVRAILVATGLTTGETQTEPWFFHHNGERDLVRRLSVIDEDERLDFSDPLVVQVSRWDPLKDMAGVMEGFAEYVAPLTDAHLMLVGPSTAQVADDPEGQAVLDAIIAAWEILPDEVRDRVHLVSLPMDDPEQNGALVNAIQRHAAIVTQKSLAEGFGLTVTEAMFKARPVVASSVGGIADQIDDQVSGVLIADPRDLESFGRALVGLLNDPDARDRIGAAARQRVIDVYLPDTSLDLWNEAVLSAMKHSADANP